MTDEYLAIQLRHILVSGGLDTEKYFFRVDTGSFGIFPYVSLRKRTWGKFSKEVDSRWTGSPFDTYEEEIIFLANRIMSRIIANKRQQAGAERFSGTY